MENLKTTKCYILLILLLVGQMPVVLNAKPIKSKEDPYLKLKGLHNMPEKVTKIFSWPSEELIGSNKRISINKNGRTKRVQIVSIEWVEKVISQDWLPSDPNYLKNNIILIEDEYDLIDATHVRWEKNDFAIEITQTKTVFTAKLKPLVEDVKADTRKAKKQKVRTSLANFIVEDAYIRTKDPYHSKRIKKKIKPVLLESCLDKAKIFESDTIIYSNCKIPDYDDEAGRDNFTYWWGRVNWWTNGKEVAFYTLKVESGAWKAGFYPTVDDDWFDSSEPEPQKNSWDLVPDPNTIMPGIPGGSLYIKSKIDYVP